MNKDSEDPFLDALRSDAAFQERPQRVEAALSGLTSSSRLQRWRPWIALAAALFAGVIAWFFFQQRGPHLPERTYPSVNTFAEVPPALAAIELEASRYATANEVAFLPPTHDLLVLSADREPLTIILDLSSAKARKD